MKKKSMIGLVAALGIMMIAAQDVAAATQIQLSAGATADVSYDSRAQSLYETKIGIESGYTMSVGMDSKFMDQIVSASVSSMRPQGATISDITPVLSDEEQQVFKEAINSVAVNNIEVNVVEDSAETVSESGMAETAEEDSLKSDLVLSIGDSTIVSTVPAEYQDEFDPEELNNGSSYGYTNIGIAQVEDHLNVRSTAEGGKIVGKMSNNAGCEIIGIEGNMAHIVSGSVEGYVSMDYLITGSAAVAYADGIVQNSATVSANGLRVRALPDGESEVLGMVAYGEELPALTEEPENGWVKVNYDGKEAYVNADYVRVGRNLKTALNMTEFLYGEGVSDVRVELCEYAKQFLGNRYVWGGTSLTKGCDCSGFTMQILGRYGVGLPHSSRAQAQMGTKISMSEAKPGDLVFYSKGGRINHVAIYIGGGQVIHASSPKTGIRITSAYYRTPTTVRRFLSDSV